MSIYEGVPVGPDACPAPGRAVEAGLVGRPSIRVLGQSMFETELDSVRSSSRWKEFKKILPQLMMIAAILALPVCVVFKHPLQRALAGEKESDAGPPIQPSSPRQNASTSTISSSDNYPMAYGLTTFLQPPGSAVYLPMRDQSIATVLSLPSDYVVSFSLFVADGGYQPEFSSIVQLSTTELRGRLPFPYAQRARESNVPGISFMHKSRRLVVRVDPQHQYNPQMMNSWCVLDQHIPVGHTANVEVRLGEGHVVVRLNGVVATEQGGQCMRQRALTQHPPIRPVYVYAPDPRIPAARAVISNLTITRTQPVAGCLSSRACNRVWEAVQPDKAQPCIFPTYSLDKPSVDCTGRFPMSGINSSATTWWFLRNQPTQLSRAPSIVFDEGAEGKSAGLHAVIDLPVDFRLEFTVIPHEIQYLGTMPVWSNIFRIGTGADCCEYGTRVPAVYFRPGTLQLYVVHGSTAQGWFCSTSRAHPAGMTLQMGVATTVRIDMLASRIDVFLDGALRCHEARRGTKAHEGAHLFMTDPMYPAANATIDNFSLVKL